MDIIVAINTLHLSYVSLPLGYNLIHLQKNYPQYQERALHGCLRLDSQSLELHLLVADYVAYKENIFHSWSKKSSQVLTTTIVRGQNTKIHEASLPAKQQKISAIKIIDQQIAKSNIIISIPF